MDNIYFCQFSSLVGDNVFLPYSVGTIISYINTNKVIRDKYNIDIMFLKEDDIIKKFDDPKLVFISVYIWNFKYSMDIAKMIKDKYSDCRIVLGGHHVPYYSFNFFKQYPFIDILVHGEGEKVTEDILMGKCKYTINNISFNKELKSVDTRKVYNNCNLFDIPSPYLTGVFDKILKMPYNFTASLETNRGCPYGCAYCDWGSTLTSEKKLRFFDQDRVLKEIEWFGKNNIEFVFGTDSNFGIIEKDMDWIDKIIETKKKYGYPQKFRVCYAKNSNERIFNMNMKLNKHDISKGATLSFQTLNKESEKAVGRINMSIDDYGKYIKKYNDNKIPTYTEMIIGLPEETYDTFCNGLCLLLEHEQHHSIVVYYCQIYPNSKINTDAFRKEYGIESIKIPMYPTHTRIQSMDDVDEEEIIIATNKTNKKEWVDTCLFSWAVQAFHCLSITSLMARYLRKKKGISYRVFYNRLLDFAQKHPKSIIGREYHKVKRIYEEVQNGQGFYYINRPYGDLNWTIEEGSFLSFILDIDKVYSELIDIYSDIDEHIVTSLAIANRYLLKQPMNNPILTNDENMKDILEFAGIDPSHEQYRLINIEGYNGLEDYAHKTVWYGRKGGQFLYDDKNIEGRERVVCKKANSWS